MKRIMLFCFSLILIVSCQKDEIETININTQKSVSLRTSSPSDCGYIEELCMPCGQRVLEKEDIIFVDIFGFTGGENNDKNKYRIASTPMFSGSDEYLITASDGSSYILSNTTNQYIISKSKNTTIPRGIKNIFRLDQSKLRENNYTNARISQDLGASITRNSDNVIIINSNLLGNDDDIQARIYDPCEGQFMEMMLLYREKLNMPELVSSSANTWMSLADPIFSEIASDIDIETDCVDTRLVVDGILASSGFALGEDQRNSLKINYLTLLLGLDETEAGALDNASSELIDELYNLSECGRISFCPTSSDPNDIIEDIVKDLINESGSISKDDFLEELEKNDWIVLAENFSSNAKVNCVWNTIINSDSELMCSTLSNFFGGTKFNVNLYALDISVPGSTDILPSGNFSITIDVDFIEEACPIEILKTILHESIHAEILRRQNTYTLAQLGQMYPEMMTYFNDTEIDDPHHEYMAAKWFDKLLIEVKKFYPTGYTESQYKAIVWSGLHTTSGFNASGFTASQLTDILNDLRENCEPCVE